MRREVAGMVRTTVRDFAKGMEGKEITHIQRERNGDGNRYDGIGRGISRQELEGETRGGVDEVSGR